MILQSLVELYEDLADQGKIAEDGWGPVKVSYALDLDDDGKIQAVVSLKNEVHVKKKVTWAPRIMDVPAPVKRSSGISANFLCDNSLYILGHSLDEEISEGDSEDILAEKKKKAVRSSSCFTACAEHHHQILDEVSHPAATALLIYFDQWNPDDAEAFEAFQDIKEELFSSANICFSYYGKFVHEIPEIRDAWLKHYSSSGEGDEGVCLVTGKKGPVAQLHPSIKGIAGAQSSGASLVSFNAESFCSYKKKQGENAPTSKYAAFAYGAALNYLIGDREHRHYLGDTIVLCWAKGAEAAYQDIFSSGFFGNEEEDSYSEQDYLEIMGDVVKGDFVDFNGTKINPDCPFYILGISPNAARLSIRFFYQSSFGKMIENILKHYDRLEIIKPDFEKFEHISLWRLVGETVNKDPKNKDPQNKKPKNKKLSSIMTGEILRAILNDTPYPASLLNGITLRIRADRKINRVRAAIIKAYYLSQRNENPDISKEEVLNVALKKDSSNEYYNLGRLFSVLEAVQSAANPGINSTIKDRYFNSASSTPILVFPTLINLTQKHLKKIDGGLKVNYDKQITEIMSLIGESFPKRLNMAQQGSFQLGYYHQTQERYQKKNTEEK